jgi:hypothetical protein
MVQHQRDKINNGEKKNKLQAEQLLTISCKGEQHPVAEWQALTFQINQFIYSDINLSNTSTAKCEQT